MFFMLTRLFKLIVLTLFISLLPGMYSIGQTTTVYIVRHAEKNMTDTTNKNPPLSKEGNKRVKALEKRLKGVKLAAVFSTNTIRTQETGRPLANSNKLSIQNYDAKDLKALAEIIKTEYAGKNVLVVGHSNTLLPTVQSFGIMTVMSMIPDNVYNLLFKVTIDAAGKAEMIQETYGKDTPAGNVSTMK
jgi:broad specificity phosphatase PhoE